MDLTLGTIRQRVKYVYATCKSIQIVLQIATTILSITKVWEDGLFFLYFFLSFIFLTTNIFVFSTEYQENMSSRNVENYVGCGMLSVYLPVTLVLTSYFKRKYTQSNSTSNATDVSENMTEATHELPEMLNVFNISNATHHHPNFSNSDIYNTTSFEPEKFSEQSIYADDNASFSGLYEDIYNTFYAIFLMTAFIVGIQFLNIALIDYLRKIEQHYNYEPQVNFTGSENVMIDAFHSAAEAVQNQIASNEAEGQRSNTREQCKELSEKVENEKPNEMKDLNELSEKKIHESNVEIHESNVEIHESNVVECQELETRNHEEQTEVGRQGFIEGTEHHGSNNTRNHEESTEERQGFIKGTEIHGSNQIKDDKPSEGEERQKPIEETEHDEPNKTKDLKKSYEGEERQESKGTEHHSPSKTRDYEKPPEGEEHQRPIEITEGQEPSEIVSQELAETECQESTEAVTVENLSKIKN